MALKTQKQETLLKLYESDRSAGEAKTVRECKRDPKDSKERT
jgi:hypothetical protein